MMKKLKDIFAQILSKRKRNKIVSEIISNVYHDRYSPEDIDRIRKIFVLWYENEADAKLKEKYMFKVFDLYKESPEDLKELDGMLSEFRSRMNFHQIEQEEPVLQRSLSFGRVMLRAAAVLVPAMIVGGSIFYLTQEKDTSVIAQWTVPYGETKDITLEDSTKVWINAGSELEVSIGENERVAKLSGESFFSVTKDETKPFIVKAEGVEIKVLGTEFNVKAYSEETAVTVTLTQGKIDVTINGIGDWRLVPNQQFVYDKLLKKGEVKTLSDSETDRSNEWRDGRLDCYLMNVPDILSAIERRYDVKFEIDPSIHFDKSREYVISFLPTDSLDFIMRQIKLCEDKFDFSIDGKTIKLRQ